MTAHLASNRRNRRANRAAALGRARQRSMRELKVLVAYGQLCAARAFRHDELKLRNDFQILAHGPDDLASLLQRARAVLAACQNPANAPYLIGKGWYDKHASALRDAIIALDPTG